MSDFLFQKRRLNLIQQLNAIPPSQFDEIVYALKPPPGTLSAASGSQGSRVSELLQWVEGPTGPGLPTVLQILETFITAGLSSNDNASPQPEKLLSEDELRAFRNLIQSLRRDLQEIQLDVVYQSGFNSILSKFLLPVTSKTGQRLRADRVTIFFLNSQQELSSIIAQDGAQGSLEIRVPVGKGFAGTVALTKQTKRINHLDLNSPEAAEAKRQFERTHYRTHHLLTTPVLNSQGDLIAVIQLVNKLKAVTNPQASLTENLDEQGFNEEDERHLAYYLTEIQDILEDFQDYYKITQRIQEVIAFTKTVQSLSEHQYNLEEVRELVARVAGEFMEADRSTVWLFDKRRQQLYSEIETQPGSYEEIRIDLGQGYAGRTAETRQILNIPFDLYDDQEASRTAQAVDRQTGYRTCSLLCMPILSLDQQLLGVVQLVNKRKKGCTTVYDPNIYPKAPECFEASFTDEDVRRLRALNRQIAAAIQAAKQSASIRQDDHLFRVLTDITQFAKTHLLADRATIFLLDSQREELWSLMADTEQARPLEIRLSLGQGIAGRAAATQTSIRAANVQDDPCFEVAHRQDRKSGYRTHSLLALPLINEANQLISVVEFVNKLEVTKAIDKKIPLEQRINPRGFDEMDEMLFFERYAEPIRQMLEGFQNLYSLSQRQQKIASLIQALNSINQSNLSATEATHRIMSRAKALVNADRITLWLFDQQSQTLQAEVLTGRGIGESKPQVPIGQGYVGHAAAIQKVLNVPFDLYEDEEGSRTARAFDQRFQYRTCSLLCVPILNLYDELVGVMQLVNKKREGEFPPYDHRQYPEAPECFQASFDQNDERIMEVFNTSAGNSLYHIELCEVFRTMLDSEAT